MTINVDLSKGELHNVSLINGKLSVRECLVKHLGFAAIKTQFGADVIYGFSVEDPNTTEIFHYFFLRRTDDQLLTCVVTTEEYQVVNYTSLGIVSGELTLTHAVLNLEVHVNGPGLSTAYYGFIGSSLVPSVKVNSRNEVNTPTINVPVGLVAVFGDRMAIAQYNTVFFSDPGFKFRTYTGANTVTVPSKIYGLVQANNGVLYIITAQDIYFITKDALGQGQLVYGFLGNIKGYEANNYRSGAVVGSSLFTIGNQSINVVNGQTIDTMEIIKFDRKRRLSQAIGDPNLKQTSTMWTLSNGFILNNFGKLFLYDNENRISSWMYPRNGGDLTIAGILKDRNGKNLFLTKGFLTGILELFGSGQEGPDFTNDIHPVGYACITVETEPKSSELIRFITTVSDNVGLTQEVAIRGQVKSKTTPAVNGQTNIVEGSNWNAGNYSAVETKSRRHGMAIRTNDISFEVAIEGSMSLIGEVSIDQEINQDRNRP